MIKFYIPLLGALGGDLYQPSVTWELEQKLAGGAISTTCSK